MIKLYKRSGVTLLGCALLVALHFYRLSSIPGLHYDEAWAMNYAWRIAHEPGFWPLTAMSPYTAPWAHYWAALWMKLLGPSVLVFRGSQVMLALGGLGFLAFSLPATLRLSFLAALLLLPGLILNQRFAIELTGLHVLCYGVCMWAARRKNAFLSTAALLAGTTAHILFYAVALAGVGTRLLEGPDPQSSPAQRNGRIVYFTLVAFFFLHVLLTIPEKGKAAALVFSCLAALAVDFLPIAALRIWKWKGWTTLVSAVALLFVLNCVFFAQGAWTFSLTEGTAEWKSGVWIVAVLGLFAWIGLSTLSGFRSATTRTRTYTLLLFLFFGLMMLKPAPRYFEIPLITLAVLLANDWYLRWSQQLWRYYNSLFIMALAVGSIGIFFAYFDSHPADADVHFAAFKDSSRDFLDKQSLVRFLGGSGCAPGDIHTGDPRLKEELDALALGDWPVDHSGPCRWNFVSRRSDANAVGEPWNEFVLRRKN